MASSEDEEEMVPESVTNYHFVDENEEPVSFSVLPVQWEAGEVPEAGQNQVFLHGIAEDGLEKVYKQVTAWKMDLENQVPGVWVLSVDKKWIKLQKPRKSFEDTIRKILITLQCLHYLKRNPESSDKSLWEYIRKVFSHYEIRASEYDLLDHLPLMRKCVDRDESLAKSKLLIKFLDEKPQKRDSFNEVVDHNSDFINDDDDGMDEQNGDANGDESGEEWSDCFDSVCAICDNGGELLCCEGKCLRSFHAIKGSGQDSDCRTLGYSRAYVHAIQNFLCLNCQKNQHQCFACGQLGSSEKSSAAEVFSCVSATCGHFYHPQCVANLLHPENEDEAMELEKKISAGETFTCPVHKCLICKQGEKKEVKELQFATCRRCPRSYHRKCLPRKISFEDIEEEDITQRAWDDLIPNRILIYCLKHKIDEDIGTPRRNHIKFPEVPGEKKVRPPDSNKGKVLVKRKAEGLPSTKIVKATQRLSSGAEESTSKKSDKTLSGQTFGSFKKLKTADTSRKTLEDGTKYFGSEESKISVREERTKAAGLNKELMSGKSMRKDLAGSSIARTVPSASSNLISKASSSVAMVEKKSSLPVIDKEVEKRIMLLVRNSPLYSLTLEEFMKRKEVPSTHAYSARHVDKSITQGKVEGSTEAVRAALKKLEDGCSIEDARAVCEPAILYQIIKWKIFEDLVKNLVFLKHEIVFGELKLSLDLFMSSGGANIWDFVNLFELDHFITACNQSAERTEFTLHTFSLTPLRAFYNTLHLFSVSKPQNKLRVYLAPFLHGMRYTSFGRHFTKVDKLKEIVDKLHWYVQNGDMIVDFCCGANDFSILMKEKLDSTGKKCSFRNYDVIQPKNDFNFEKKDWMKVRPKDLPTGSQLIMGLNPPFGVKASLANKFIDKALEFKPKLLILIVPKETERLDVKEAQYDLIWEDDEKLAGKAFYLPGSVDANDKQMEQWNTKPPPLYLWSRPDWTPKHQTIAKKQGHMSKVFEISDVGKQIDAGRQNDVPTEQNDVPTKHNDQAEDSPPRHQNDIKMKESSTPSGKKKKSRKRKNSKRAETSRVIEDDRLSDMSISPPSRADSRDNLDGHMASKTLNTHSEITTDFGGFSRPGSDYGTKYGGVQSSSLTDIDEIERRYAPSSMAATFTGSSHKLSTPGIGGLKYGGGIQETMEEYVPGYVRDGGSDGFGRRAYTDGERSIGIDIHSKIMLYGQQYTDELAQRSRYTLGGAGSGLGLTSALSTPSYGLSGSAIGSSATQRYAPRLDEMNHVMRDPFMPDVPFLGRGSGMGNNADAPGSWAGGLPPDSGGYAARSQHQFHNGSSGWLNE